MFALTLNLVYRDAPAVSRIRQVFCHSVPFEKMTPFTSKISNTAPPLYTSQIIAALRGHTCRRIRLSPALFGIIK